MTTQSTSSQQSSAIGALVLSIVSLFIPIIGLIAAIIALVMISKVTDPEQKGLRTATKVIAWISIIMEAGIIILIMLGLFSTIIFTS